jgi:hypothetical protein
MTKLLAIIAIIAIAGTLGTAQAEELKSCDVLIQLECAYRFGVEHEKPNDNRTEHDNVPTRQQQPTPDSDDN